MEQDQTYRNWKQSNPVYNQEEAWPSSLFPEATYHHFVKCGCLVTSLAIMLRHFNIEKETDETRFNPWILNQKLIEAGAFDRYANLWLGNIEKVYPLEYVGMFPYSKEAAATACKEGQPFLITVPGVRGERHFVVPDYLTEDDLAIIDCAWGKKYMSEFDTILELRRFRTIRPD